MFDLRNALRALYRRPAVAAVAVVMIAVGVGGATSIFSVADAVVLRPLPYTAADRLLVIHERDGQRSTVGPTSYPAFTDWRDHSQSFESLAAVTSEILEVTLTGRNEPTVVEAAAVSGGFFRTLGGVPARGRVLLPSDDQPGAPAAVLSEALWRERFGADPAVVGTRIVLEERPYTIIGVMPSEFAYPAWAQLWIPLRSSDALLTTEIADGLFEDVGAGVGWLTVIGRLRDGVSPGAAQPELTAIWQRMYARVASGFGRTDVDPRVIDRYIDSQAAVLTSFSDVTLGPARPTLLAILGASLLVLLIACANVAGLLVMGALERRREMSVRLALGATRLQLIRASVAESLLLAFLGGCGGVLMAVWGTPLLAALSPDEIPRIGHIAVNLRVVGFAVAAAVLVAMVSALAPVALVRRATVEHVIGRASSRIAEGRTRFRAVLVVSEVALAVFLLIGAGLMIRTFLNLRDVPLGFETEPVLTVSLAPNGERYARRERRQALYEELLQRVRALPGVESAAVVTRHPLWSTQGYDWPYTAEGQADEDAWRNPPLNLLAASADYFRTMGIRLVRGRAFRETDRDGQPGVVVIGESLARRAWPGQDPIGKRLRMPLPGTPYNREWLTVVGVAAEARYRELEATRFDAYVSYKQADIRLNSVMVRTSVDPSTLARAVREAVRDLDPNLPVMETRRMSDVVSGSLARRRFTARLLGAFAVVALALAALGLYALLAHSVASRTREMGLRVALGARAADVRRMVVGHGLRLTTAGLLLGVGAALMGGRLLENLLYGVSARDPVTLTVAPLVLTATAAVAALLPAVRATRVDPAVVLRDE